MKNLKSPDGKRVVRVPDKKPHEINGVKELLAKGWKFCPNKEYRTSKKVDKPKKKSKKKS